MDFTEIYKKKGFKFKYTYLLGSLDDPQSLNMIDAWEMSELTPSEIEEQKRMLMKNYKQPVISVECSEI